LKNKDNKITNMNHEIRLSLQLVHFIPVRLLSIKTHSVLEKITKEHTKHPFVHY